MIKPRARYIHTDSAQGGLGLTLTGAGFNTQRSGRSKAGAWNRTLNEFALVYLVAGHGILQTDRTNGKLPVRKGDLFILFPGINHGYYATHPDGWSEYWLMFSGPYSDLLRELGVLTPESPVLSGVNPRVKSLMDGILSDLDAPTPQIDDGVLKLFELFMSLKNGGDHQEPSSQSVVDQAKSYIATAPEKPVDFEAMARELGTSYSNLRRLFKKQTGLPLRQYQLQLQVNKAKELLSISEATVKEVAGRCGFDDPYYFSRLFRQHTGVPPSAWRH